MVRSEGFHEANLFTHLPLRKQLIFTLVFNTLIALGVSVVLSNTLLNAFVYAQTIGLTMFSTVQVYFRFFSFRLILIIAPLVIGSLLGLALAILLSNWIDGSDMADVYHDIVKTPGNLMPSLVLALGFGSLAVYFTLNSYPWSMFSVDSPG